MRILVIEDDRKLAELIRRGLTEQGYAVDVTYAGKEGERLIQDINYDLVTLDIILADNEGISVSMSANTLVIEQWPRGSIFSQSGHR